ncbi:hypothetical protein BKI52_01005 [marine bacterium AO1-C]|nr:hypothetical protein BKI52_01005 [marine bacterium AO1-C]
MFKQRFSYLSLVVFIFSVGLVVLLANVSLPATNKASDVHTCYGDSLQWKLPDYQSQSWTRNFQDSVGTFWVRATINIQKPTQALTPQGLSIDFTGIYELFWDGQLIGRNYPSSKTPQSVASASLHHLFIIPDSLHQQGQHLIALRVFRFKNYGKSNNPLESDYTDLNVGNYLTLAQQDIIITAYVHIIAGIFLVIGLYYTFIFLVGNRHLRFLLFAIICLSFFTLLIFEYLRFHYYYHYSFHYIRLVIIALLTLIIAALLPLFFMHRFPFGYKQRVMGGMLSIVALIWIFVKGFDPKTSYTILISFSVSLFLVIRAIRQSILGSFEALLGIIVFFVAFFLLNSYDLKLFLGFGFLIVFMLLSLTIQMREQRREYEASLVHSSRLELEMLKKNIQPHFLMNSLASVIAWMEDDPKVGTQFIAALAQELEIMIDVSSKKLIPVAREIQLCESYLLVMSLRKEINYQFNTEGILPQDLIPPALIHTAVENGITHNQDYNGEMSFFLSFEKTKHQRKYTLISSGQSRRTIAKKTGGTGLKYMEARLQESFPNRWELHSEAITQGWKTEIVISEPSL